MRRGTAGRAAAGVQRPVAGRWGLRARVGLAIACVAALIAFLLLPRSGKNGAPPSIPTAGPPGPAAPGPAPPPTPPPSPMAEEPPAPPAAPARLEGAELEILVKDPAGNPVADAEVILFRASLDGGFAYPGGTRVPPARTGADGCALLRIGREDHDEAGDMLRVHALRGEAAAFLELRKLPGGERSRREIVLRDSGAVSGIVRRRSGEVVPGALVELSLGSAADVALRTDGGGRFSFPGVPRHLVDDLSWLTAEAPESLRHQRKVLRSDVGGVEMEILLDPLWSLRGRCVDAAGAVLAGLPVTVTVGNSPANVDSREGVTGEDGVFLVRGIDDDSATLRIDGGERGVKVVDRLRPGGRELLDLGDLVLLEGEGLRGIVLREDGAPVAGAPVLLTTGSGSQVQARTTTDGGGRFRFTVAEGRYGIAVLPAEWSREAEGPGSGDPAETRMREEHEKILLLMGDEQVCRREGLVPGEAEVRIVIGGLRVLYRFLDAGTGKALNPGRVLVKLHPDGGGMGSEDAVTQGGNSDREEPLVVRIQVRKPGLYRTVVEVTGREVEHPSTVVVTEERESIVEVKVGRKAE